MSPSLAKQILPFLFGQLQDYFIWENLPLTWQLKFVNAFIKCYKWKQWKYYLQIVSLSLRAECLWLKDHIGSGIEESGFVLFWKLANYLNFQNRSENIALNPDGRQKSTESGETPGKCEKAVEKKSQS